MRLAPKAVSAPQDAWSAAYGDLRDDSGVALAIDPSGDVIVTGFFHGAMDLGCGAIGEAVSIDSSGNAVVAGGFSETASLGGASFQSVGLLDAFIAKYGVDGAHLASSAFGSVGDDIALLAAVDSRDQIAVSGFFGDVIDLGGGELAPSGKYASFLAEYVSSSGGFQHQHRRPRHVPRALRIDGHCRVVVRAWRARR